MASGHVRSMPDTLWEATSGGPSPEKLEAVVVDMLVHAYGIGR
jgi:hypothetical protein